MGQKWGQHFLSDFALAKQIVDLANLDKNDFVLEIGPGQGVLTNFIMGYDCQLKCVEIDPELARDLKHKHQNNDLFNLISADVLSVNEDELFEVANENKNIKLISNLPYQVSAPLFFKFVKNRQKLASVTIMLQKELADRVTATEKQTKDYSPISLACQIGFDVISSVHVSPSSFNPPPKVDSTVLHLAPKANNYPDLNETAFFSFVRNVFNQRRKTVMNNLKRIDKSKIVNIDKDLTQLYQSKRPEDLTLVQYLELFNLYKD